jgi:nicotinamide mononucleotide adenylyltransferase
VVLNLDGGLTVQGAEPDLLTSNITFIKVAFILNNVVEKIMNLVPPMPEIIFGNYQFRDVTEAKRAEKESSKFFFEVESEDGVVLPVSSDESFWSIMASHPLAVEIPAELDVQLGWTYTVETGFVSN